MKQYKLKTIEIPESGVFETLRAYNGEVFKLGYHLKRLERSAKALNLFLPSSKKVEKAIKKTFLKSGLRNAYIRISCSGVKNLVVIVKPLPAYPEECYKNGVSIVTVPTQRNIPHAVEAKIKCNDFLSGVIAKIESASTFEAILLNKDGYVTEGTVSNIFIVYPNPPQSPPFLQQTVLLTPPSYLGVLEGITRKTVMEIAEKIGIHVEEKPFTRYNLYNADECFLTNTTMEIMPVVNVDGRIIGDGKPGVVTSRLLKEFRKLTTEQVPSI